MIVWPEVYQHETGWTWRFEMLGLRYVRLGLFPSTGALNQFPLYAEPWKLVLGWATVRPNAFGRRLHRVAYLNCANPDHLDGYDLDRESGNLCVPTSINWGCAVTTEPTEFGRWQSGRAQTVMHDFAERLAQGKRHWDSYSKTHGLPPQTGHVERWRI